MSRIAAYSKPQPSWVAPRCGLQWRLIPAVASAFILFQQVVKPTSSSALSWRNKQTRLLIEALRRQCWIRHWRRRFRTSLPRAALFRRLWDLRIQTAPQVAQAKRVTNSISGIHQSPSRVPPAQHRLGAQRARQARAGRKCLERRINEATASSQALQNQRATGSAWDHCRSYYRARLRQVHDQPGRNLERALRRGPSRWGSRLPGQRAVSQRQDSGSLRNSGEWRGVTQNANGVPYFR